MTEEYGILITCRNCRKQIEVNIPKGKTVVSFLKDLGKDTVLCKNCGCVCESWIAHVVSPIN